MSDSVGGATGLIDVAVLDDDADFLGYVEDFLNDEGLYSVHSFDRPESLFAARRAASAGHRAAGHEDGQGTR